MKAIVTIRRQGGNETIHGEVVGETTTHYKVHRKSSKTDQEVCEWFAKQSPAVRTVVS